MIPAAEQTNVADWVALIFYLFTCCVFFIVSTTFCVRRKDPHYTFALFPNLIGLTLFAISHLTGVLIANEYLADMGYINSLACPLWNFFLQYVTGVGMWITYLLQRLLYYMSFAAYREAHRDTWLYKTKRRNAVMTFVIMFPIAIICLLTIWTEGSQSDVNDRNEPTCNNATAWKVAVAIWIGFVWLLSLFVIVYTYGSGKLRNPVFDERFKCLTVIMLSLVVILVGAIMVFTGALSLSLYRSLHMIILCIFYLVSFFMLSMSVWKKQNKYVDEASSEALLHMNEISSSIQNVPTTKEALYKSDSWMASFISYCRLRLGIENNIIRNKELQNGELYIKDIDDLAMLTDLDQPGLDKDTRHKIEQAKRNQTPDMKQKRISELKSEQAKFIKDSLDIRTRDQLPTTSSLLGCIEHIKAWIKIGDDLLFNNKKQHISTDDIRTRYKQIMAYVDHSIVNKIILSEEDQNQLNQYGNDLRTYNQDVFQNLYDMCVGLLMQRYFTMWKEDLYSGQYREVCMIRADEDVHKHEMIQFSAAYLAADNSNFNELL